MIFRSGRKMKIHIQTGALEFEHGSITRDMDRQAFLTSALGKTAEVFVDNEPYVTYRIHPERDIVATVSFHGPRLTGVSWLFELSESKEKEWTESLELERRQVHDEWLLRELGKPPYRYSWGELSSDFDPRGCVSDIILNYAT